MFGLNRNQANSYVASLPQIGKVTRTSGLGGIDKQGLNEKYKRERTLEARQLTLEGLTRKEVATKMGLNIQTIRRYCEGLSFNIVTGVKVSAVINQVDFADLEYLVTNERNMSRIIREALRFALQNGFK